MNFVLSNISSFIVVFLKYSINTPLRLAHFLSQMSHETVGFTAFVENTNYTSLSRLLEVFGSHFTSTADAQKYVGKPIAIANRVYANRLGNGNEASGDGYKYRGRGFVHLTGKANYQSYKIHSGIDIVSNPDLAARLDIALDIAGWYWESRNINIVADNDDVVAVTKKINGGTNGLADRKSRLAFYKKQNLMSLLTEKKKK